MVKREKKSAGAGANTHVKRPAPEMTPRRKKHVKWEWGVGAILVAVAVLYVLQKTRVGSLDVVVQRAMQAEQKTFDCVYLRGYKTVIISAHNRGLINPVITEERLTDALGVPHFIEVIAVTKTLTPVRLVYTEDAAYFVWSCVRSHVV